MTPRRIKKLLIANRGEIALRIISTARAMRLKTVAVFSEADAAMAHVAAADEARRLDRPQALQSYLNIPAILQAAAATGADAIHPGYGFLSESAEFGRAVENAGLLFVGPPPEVLSAAGDKVGARRLAQRVGVPVVAGTETADLATARSFAAQAGYPILIKAAAGGGGRGIRVVQDEPRWIPRSKRRRGKPRPPLVTGACSWKNIWPRRATLRFRCWATPAAG